MSGGMGVDSYDLSDPLFRRLPISFREVYTDQIDTILRIFIIFL